MRGAIERMPGRSGKKNRPTGAAFNASRTNRSTKITWPTLDALAFLAFSYILDSTILKKGLHLHFTTAWAIKVMSRARCTRVLAYLSHYELLWSSAITGLADFTRKNSVKVALLSIMGLKKTPGPTDRTGGAPRKGGTLPGRSPDIVKQ